MYLAPGPVFSGQSQVSYMHLSLVHRNLCPCKMHLAGSGVQGAPQVSSVVRGVSVVQDVPQALLFFSGPDGGAGSLGVLGQTAVLLLSLGLASESRAHRMDPVAYSEVFQKPTEGDAGSGGSDMTVSSVSILARTVWRPLLRGRGLMDLVSQQVASGSLWVMVPGPGLVRVTSKQASWAQQEPTGGFTCT